MTAGATYAYGYNARKRLITMSSRAAPEAPPDVALTSLEIKILDRLVLDKRSGQPPARGLAFYAVKIARLGGYLNRTRDPPPGNLVMWAGVDAPDRHRPRLELGGRPRGKVNAPSGAAPSRSTKLWVIESVRIR